MLCAPLPVQLQQVVGFEMSERLEFDVFRIEDCLQVEVNAGPDHERIVFRIEILRSMMSNACFASVHRQDLFELRVFGDHASQLPGGIAHHEIWVKDDVFSGQEFSAGTPDELRELVLNSVRSMFQG